MEHYEYEIHEKSEPNHQARLAKPIHHDNAVVDNVGNRKHEQPGSESKPSHLHHFHLEEIGEDEENTEQNCEQQKNCCETTLHENKIFTKIQHNREIEKSATAKALYIIRSENGKY